MTNTTDTNQLLSPYWHWSKFLSDDFMNLLEKEDNEFEKTKGIINGSSIEYRNSDITVLDPIHWFSGILFNVAVRSNIEANWNFNISFPSAFQLAHYRESQFYNWHSDLDMIENTKFVRKLTVIAPINRKDEYEGGVFELMNMPPINLDRGDIIVFPSNLVHRVTPVTKGIRKSATIWINGIKSW